MPFSYSVEIHNSDGILMAIRDVTANNKEEALESMRQFEQILHEIKGETMNVNWDTFLCHGEAAVAGESGILYRSS